MALERPVSNKKIKILSTLGPSSLKEGVIRRLDHLGVDIFRINLSHTKLELLEKQIETIQHATDKAICIDTEGAQVRNCYVENNQVVLEEGDRVEVVADESIGTRRKISINSSYALSQIQVGSLISIDFDGVLLQVLERLGLVLQAKVMVGGVVGSNKAVTIDSFIDLPVLSEKDVASVQVALQKGVSHFALSFASTRESVLELRSLVGKNAFIISKVESRRGVQNLDNILEVTDALLIDRGDLSREVSLEKIPLLQKKIIQRANQKKVPVYVATNLLESMIKVTKPTRAEVNDVVNTLLDGADGLVLAAETAIGQYPTQCVAMVSSMVDHFSEFHPDYDLKKFLNDHSSFLVKPHGGVLVQRLEEQPVNAKEIESIPSLFLQESYLMDVEQITLGTFSPLEGFMNKEEVDAVLENMRLPSGVSWPLPVVLPVTEKQAKSLKEGQVVRLVYEKDQCTYALLHLEQIFTYDLKSFSEKMYGTNDISHPGVHRLYEMGNIFLSGKVTLIRRLQRAFKEYELTPRQTRAIFESKNWRRIVGFHTRNVLHRAHETLQMDALEKYNCDGLFVHPVVGLKKKDDYSADIILQSYEWMLKNHYPKGKVLLGAFSTYSRYAGPREAVFTALCRKNFGCSHFIVGRDHTGVGNFYPPKAAWELFESIDDLGIIPIFFDDVYFCNQCRRHVERCCHDKENFASISGSQARDLFRRGETPPDWFMRKDVAQLILDAMKEGREVFVS